MTSALSFQTPSLAPACRGFLSNPSLSNEDIPRIPFRQHLLIIVTHILALSLDLRKHPYFVSTAYPVISFQVFPENLASMTPRHFLLHLSIVTHPHPHPRPRQLASPH
jgi:hypothetical protein